MPTLLDAEKKKWTYADYQELDDETRCEIIEGELSMTPAPNLEHQRVSRNLEFSMLQYVEAKKLGEVLNAPVDVVLDEANIVQPDLVFVSKQNFKILEKNGIMGSPDLAVEILSPSSLYRDRYQKKDLYEKFGVRELWIMDPANQTIEIFCLAGGKYKLFCFASRKDKAKSSVIEGFEIEVSQIMCHSSASGNPSNLERGA